MAELANLAYFRTEQTKQNAQLSYDEMALYFCVDTGKLYRGAVDFTEFVRFVNDHNSLLVPAKSALYIEPTGAGWVYTKDFETENDVWKQVIYPAGTGSNVVIVTVINESSTDDTVPSAKAVFDLFQTIEKQTIDLSEYAKTSDVDTKLESYALKTDIKNIADAVDYEVAYKPIGTLVDYRDKEIRIMCPADTEYALQNVGAGGDANTYYIGFKAYAPFGDVVSFKEDLNKVINDQTMYYFENNEFAGVDEYGRKYSIVWLPVANYDTTTKTWTYYGKNSTTDKYIGWDYCVEWYNSSNVKVASDLIRINLSNEDCYDYIKPFYMADYLSDGDMEDLTSDIAALKEATTWREL